jgi:hypothetical protein
MTANRTERRMPVANGRAHLDLGLGTEDLGFSTSA